jgi:restriction system protein
VSPQVALLALGFFAIVALGRWFVDFAHQQPLQAVVLVLVPVSIIVLFAAYKIHRWRAGKRAERAIQLADVDVMGGHHFERYVGALLRHQGYKVELTGRPGDQGCDLILSRNGERIACQTKRYESPVSNSAVQEAVASVPIHRCHRAMVVTNSRFTAAARQLAAAWNCELIDRERLGALIAEFREDQGSR